VQEVDVLRGLEDTLTLLGEATQGLDVVREYEPDLPPVTALASELNQVWLNLVSNACDALRDVPEPVLTLRARRRDEDVVVEVEDNGPGIPVELQERLFDAYYTTKPPGEGTGLGLQTSHRIVVEHGGDVSLICTPGRTTFRVTLPCTSAEVDRLATPDAPPPGQSRPVGATPA
jgi:signal transduction histidine kinase